MRSHWLLLAFIAVKTIHLTAEPLSCKVHAEASILMNADTGTILFEKNAHELFYPASITKIATAAYTLNRSEHALDEIVTADQEAIVSVTEESKKRNNYTSPAYWLVPGSSHIGIKKGEEMSLKDLLYGLMIASGNDAANVIAMHVGGTVPDFMDSVNDYMKDIGCIHTTFYNPHGLHHPKHQTTAYDMAMLTRDALKNATFREIVSTVRYPRPKTNKQDTTTLVQTNRLLKKGKHYYAKAIGVKTGYTSLSGSTLVAAAKNGDRTLIAVMLKCKEREETLKDAIALFESAFNQPKVKRVLLKSGAQDMKVQIEGAASVAKTFTEEDVAVEYYPAEEPRVKCMLHWNQVSAPVAQGQLLGEIRLVADNGTVIQSVPLLAQEKVESTWWWSVKQAFAGNSGIIKVLGVILTFALLGGFLFLLRRR